MPQAKEGVEIRSEEVQEILSHIPHWMIRWGNVLILLLIIMLLFISWFVKYPDVITTEIMITTSSPPEKIYAKYNSNFEVFLVKNNELVKKNQLITVLESNAYYKDVLHLKSILDTIMVNQNKFRIPIDNISSLILGEIALNYSLFEIDYNNLTRTTIKNRKLLKETFQSFYQLKKSIKDWEKQFVIKSPSNGKVSFLSFWNKNKTVKKGDLIFTITPSKNTNYIGKIKAPATNSGKIKEGQTVQIKLVRYPSEEFGEINGTIQSISIIPDEDGNYLIDIELPRVLITSYGKTIEFRHEMKGSANIITEDLRLIERFFYQLKNIVK
ncbi:MAG: HlyD family secretion protein [Cellulophaga sp.]